MIIPKILKAPLILVVLTSFIAAIYAGYNDIQEINYIPAIILGIVLALYVVGWLMERENVKQKEAARNNSED